MTLSRAPLLRVACLVILAAACGSPTKPSVTVAAARPTSPADGAVISYYSQPLTLHISNGETSAGVVSTDSFEVATDAAFTDRVATKDVPQNPSGDTSVTVTTQLMPSKDYYWRVTTTGDKNHAVSATFKFSVGPVLVVQPPVPVQPLAGSFVHKRPTFTVADAARNGPATLSYRFDVATDAGFSHMVASGTVPEMPVQTSFTPASDLASGAAFYWRAQAIDGTSGIASGYSAAQGFTTVSPDDGTYRYILTLHLAWAANCVFTGVNSRFPVDPPQLSDVAFDDGLVVSGDRLRYSLPYLPGIAGLTLDMQRTGAQPSRGS